MKLTGAGVLEIQLTNPDGSAFTPPVSMSLTDFANLQLEVFKNSGFQNLISSTSFNFDLDGDGTLDATYLAAQVAASANRGECGLKSASGSDHRDRERVHVACETDRGRRFRDSAHEP